MQGRGVAAVDQLPVYACVHKHTCTHTYAHKRPHASVHTRVHIHTHTKVRDHAHAQTGVCTCTRTAGAAGQQRQAGGTAGGAAAQLHGRGHGAGERGGWVQGGGARHAEHVSHCV